MWLVPDFGGQSLDTDPNLGQYRHFYGTIIDVRTDINPYKGVRITSSDKYVVLWIVCLNVILVEEILVTQNASKIFVFVNTPPKGFKCKKRSYFHEQFEIFGTSR